jgi:DNA-binding transcriptional LysR family regulator
MDGLSLRWVEAFRATLRAGGVSNAARLLGISQPAVSQHLKALEAAGGLRLFDRRRGRLLPTAEAQLLLTEVERVFSGLEQVRRRMLALQAHASATLHVGCLPALGMGLVPRAVARFVAQHPHARVELQIQSSNDLRDALADGVLDLAVMADESDVTGLNASVFYELPAVCVLPLRHRLARRRAVTPRDLVDEPFIALARGDRTRERIERVLAEHGVTPRVVVETPYGATQCALAAAGTGVALVNPIVAHDMAAAARTVVRPFEPAIPFRGILAFAPGRALGVMQQTFVSACRAELDALGPRHKRR